MYSHSSSIPFFIRIIFPRILKLTRRWLLGAAITLHAVYNLLIAYGGAAQYVAYALPVLLVAAGRLSAFRLSRVK